VPESRYSESGKREGTGRRRARRAQAACAAYQSPVNVIEYGRIAMTILRTALVRVAPFG
jgi:hypothetical protein